MTGRDSNAYFSIIIVDTHPVVRRALGTLLKGSLSKIDIVEAKSIHELSQRDLGGAAHIFIVVINSDFDEDGTSPITELKAWYPDSLVIIYGEAVKPELIISYLKSGVNGYLSKQQGLNEMITCIDTVRCGERYLNAGYKDLLFEYLIENYRSSKKQDLLTPRQHEVARYLIQGLTTSAIAKKTGLHISTISTFKTAIFTKLGIDNILKLKQLFETE